jgi:hypothetical protein
MKKSSQVQAKQESTSLITMKVVKSLNELEDDKKKLLADATSIAIVFNIFLVLWLICEFFMAHFKPNPFKLIEEMTKEEAIEVGGFASMVCFAQISMWLSTFVFAIFEWHPFEDPTKLFVAVAILATLIHPFFKPLYIFRTIPSPLEDFGANIIFTMKNPLALSIFLTWTPSILVDRFSL